MRRSIVVAMVVVLVLAAVGGYFGFDAWSQRWFRAGLDQALATMPAGTTATYKTAHYSLLSHQAVVTGLHVHGEIPGQPSQPFDVAVDTIESDNPDPQFSDVWARAAANPAAFAPETAIPIADVVALKGVTVHSASLDLTEPSVRVTQPRLYPWALLHDGMPSWKDLQTSLGSATQPPDLAGMRAILRAEAAAVLGVGYASYQAGAAKVRQAVPGGDIAYDLREMSGDNFDRGVMRGATGAGIEFHGDIVGSVSIDRVVVGPLDMREPMTRLINGDPLAPALLDKIKIGRIEYDGVTVRPPGQPAVHIGGFSLGPVEFADGTPISGELRFTDVNVSPAQLPDPRVQDAFHRLGLETATMSFALAYDWNVARRLVSVRDTTLKVNELGTISLSAELANVAQDVDALKQAKLARARLRFDDASLVDRLVRAGAAESGVDPEAYRRQVADVVRQQSVANSEGSPVLRAAGEAAGDFIASPHSLTIELSPPSPVPLLALMGALFAPAKVASMVGLSVSANQK